MPRPSPVRDAVADLLSDAHAASLEELHACLLQRGTPASFSAVFRAAEHLERSGVAVRVDLGDGLARFERAGEHHEHVRCTGCGTVQPLPGCLLTDLVAAVRSATGFEVQAHHVVITGRCPGCGTNP